MSTKRASLRRKIYKTTTDKPATVISTDSNFPLCKGKDKLSVSLNLKFCENHRLHTSTYTSKIEHKVQSYPVNLALNVSSITLLLISNRIILDNENCSEFREASSQKTLKLLTGSKMAAGVGNSFKSRDVRLASGCLIQFHRAKSQP